MTYSETMDGKSVYSFTDTGIAGNSMSFPGGNFAICNGIVASQTLQFGSDEADDHSNYFMSYQYFDGSGNLLMSNQMIQSQRNAGDVTYFSYNYQCIYNTTRRPATCDSPSGLLHLEQVKSGG